MCVCVWVCFRAQHLLVVTDSGKSQHRIRLNCGGEKGVRGGKERGPSIIWKLCGIFSILCTHWSLSCLPTGRRTAGGLFNISRKKYLSVPTVTIGLLTRGSDSRVKSFYIVSPPSHWREYLSEKHYSRIINRRVCVCVQSSCWQLEDFFFLLAAIRLRGK